jgi:uncharacterized membrane protein
MTGIIAIGVLLFVIVAGRIIISRYKGIELSWSALFIGAGIIIYCVIYAKNHGSNR